MAKPATMVRVYKSPSAYKKDAARLSKDGWFVSSVTERNPRSGCARMGCLMFFALVWRPKPELVVTYERHQ